MLAQKVISSIIRWNPEEKHIYGVKYKSSIELIILFKEIVWYFMHLRVF